MHNTLINVKPHEDLAFRLWDHDAGTDRHEKSGGIICNEEWVVKLNVTKFSADALRVGPEEAGLLNELKLH